MTSYFFLHLLHWRVVPWKLIRFAPYYSEHVQIAVVRGSMEWFSRQCSQYNTCGCLLTFSSIDFFRLIGLFPNAALYSQDVIFPCYFHYVTFHWIFIYFCQCISLYVQWYFHLIFSKLLFNYLVSKLFKLLFIMCYSTHYAEKISTLAGELAH